MGPHFGGEIHKRAMDCGFPGPILSTQTRKLCPIIQSSPKGTQPTQSPSLQGAVTLQIFHIQAAECEIGDHKTTVAFSDWQFPQFKSSWFGVLQTTKHPTISPFATAGGWHQFLQQPAASDGEVRLLSTFGLVSLFHRGYSKWPVKYETLWSSGIGDTLFSDWKTYFVIDETNQVYINCALSGNHRQTTIIFPINRASFGNPSLPDKRSYRVFDTFETLSLQLRRQRQWWWWWR